MVLQDPRHTARRARWWRVAAALFKYCPDPFRHSPELHPDATLLDNRLILDGRLGLDNRFGVDSFFAFTSLALGLRSFLASCQLSLPSPLLPSHH